VLTPALKELKKHTDIEASYEVHEKIGKKTHSLKFTILPNKPSSPTPKTFLEQTPLAPVPDPLAGTEGYQALLSSGVSINSQAIAVAKRCVKNKQFLGIVLDTVDRCQTYFRTNPGIKNR
jgi:hypothetical protein